MIHHSDVSSPPFGLIFVSYICSWLTLTLCVSAVLSADVIPQPEGTADIKNLKLKDLVQTAQNRVKNALQQAKSASKSIGLAWGHLGNVYHVHGWETEAILCYQQAAELDPEAFRWFYLLGLLTYTTNPRAAAVSRRCRCCRRREQRTAASTGPSEKRCYTARQTRRRRRRGRLNPWPQKVCRGSVRDPRRRRLSW